MRARGGVLVAILTVAGCVGGGSPEEHVATFGPVGRQTVRWDFLMSIQEDLIADDGEFNVVQGIDGLEPMWGDTVTFRYLQTPHDTSGETDTFPNYFELIEVVSRVPDAVGTTYQTPLVGLVRRDADPDGTLWLPDEAFDTGVLLGCPATGCDELVGDGFAPGSFLLERTDDPVAPVHIVGRAPSPSP
jgi:hypothetical protein